MTADEAIKVLVRLRTADNALQAARLVTSDVVMQSRITNLQMQVRQLMERCEWQSEHTGPDAA